MTRQGESATRRSLPSATSLSLSALLLSTLLLTSWPPLGCQQRDQAVEDAVRAFLRAAAIGDDQQVYALLTPETQRALQSQAKLASAQTGGRQRFAAQSLLAASLTPPRHHLGHIEVLSVEGDRARVKLIDSTGKASEQWSLLRVEGGWRIELPEAVRPRSK